MTRRSVHTWEECRPYQRGKGQRKAKIWRPPACPTYSLPVLGEEEIELLERKNIQQEFLYHGVLTLLKKLA
ncbi:unnamed protein product [Urochloa humidicola]